MNRLTWFSPALLAVLAGCASGPKPKALDNAEQLFAGPRAPALRQEKPELIRDAEKLLREAKTAFDNGDNENAIVLAYASAARFQMAEDLTAAASARVLAARIRSQVSPDESREIETDRYLEIAERIDLLVARLDAEDSPNPLEKEAKKAILAARDKQSEAIGKDAPRLAPSLYAKATSHVNTAIESLELEIYEAAIRESQKAVAAFEEAMKEAGKPAEPDATATDGGDAPATSKKDDESAQKRAEEAIIRARAARARAGVVDGAERSPDFAEGTSLLGAAENNYEAQDWAEARKLAVDARRKFEAAAKAEPAKSSGVGPGVAALAPTGMRKKTEDLLVELQMRRAELIGEGRDISCRDAFGEFDAIIELAKERLKENDVERAWEFAIRAQERIKRCERVPKVVATDPGAGERGEDEAAREQAAKSIRKAQSELASARGRAPKASEVREGAELLSSAEQWFDRGRYSEAATLAEQAAARLRSARAERPTRPAPQATSPTPKVKSQAERRAESAIDQADEAQLDALERGATSDQLRAGDKRLEAARRDFDRGQFREAARQAARAKGNFDKQPPKNKAPKKPKKPELDDCEKAKTNLTRARIEIGSLPANDPTRKSAAALLQVASGEADKRRCGAALELLEEIGNLTGTPMPADEPEENADAGDGPPAPPAIGDGDSTPWGGALRALEDAVDARKQAKRRDPDATSDGTYRLGQKSLERAKDAYDDGRFDEAERQARLAESAFERVEGDAPSVDVEPKDPKKPKKPKKPEEPKKPKAEPGDDGTPAPTVRTPKPTKRTEPWRRPYFVVYRALELRDEAKAKAKTDEQKDELRKGEEELKQSRTLWAKKKWALAAARARNAQTHFENVIEGGVEPAKDPEPKEPEPPGASSEEADAALREARVVRKLCERDECKERDFEALTRAEEALASAQDSFEKDKFGYAVKLAKEATKQMNAILAKPRKDVPKPPAVDPKLEADAKEAIANAEIKQKLCESRDCDKLDLEAWLLAQKDLSAAKSARADGDFARASRLAEQAASSYEAIKASAPTFAIPDGIGSVRRSGDQLFLEPKVEFASGSTTLPPASKKAVDDLAEVLKANMKELRQVRIVGFTDNSGNQVLNQRLSAARANAVRAELISQGVPANLVVAEGMGSQNPIADNSTAAGRNANRRVEVRFALKGATP